MVIKFKKDLEQFKGIVALVFTAFVGGALLPTFIKQSVATINPYIFNFFSSFIALVFFLPFLLFSKLTISRLEFLKFCILVGVGVGLNNGLFPIGLQKTTIASSQLMVALLPIFVSFMAYFIINEPLSRKKIMSTILSILGVISLILFSTIGAYETSIGTLSGNTIILFAVLGMSFYIAISKKYLKKFPPIILAGVTYLTLTVVFSPLAFFFGNRDGWFVNATSTSVISMFISGILYVLFTGISQYGYKRVSAHLAGIINMLALPFGTLAGIVVFKESLSLALLFAIVLVVFGVKLSLEG